MRDQAVIGADGAGLGTAPAEVAPVGEFDQAGHQRPVECDVAVPPRGQQAAVPDILVIEPAHGLGPEGRTVELMVAACLEDVTGVRAGLASGAMFHRKQERLQKGPIVFPGEELLQAGKKSGDQLGFLLPGLRLRDVYRAGVVQAALVFCLDLFRERHPGAALGRVGERVGQAHEIPRLEVRQRSPVRAGQVTEIELVLHFFPSGAALSVAICAHVLLPSAPTWAAAHVGR